MHALYSSKLYDVEEVEELRSALPRPHKKEQQNVLFVVYVQYDVHDDGAYALDDYHVQKTLQIPRQPLLAMPNALSS